MIAGPFGSLQPGRSTLLSTALFWALGGLLWHGLESAPAHRVLGLAAQFWLAYSLVWIALAVLARRSGMRWPTLLLAACGAAVVGAALGLPLREDYALLRVDSPAWLAQRLLPAVALSLTLHLLPLAAHWRASRRHAAEAARLRQGAVVADLSRQLTLAELKTLQAQVEPHFLYNTLAGIQYLVRHDAPLADRMLGRLHDYLRLALPAMREPVSTLAREFALAEAYLALMQMRLGDRLRVTLQLPEALASRPFAPLMLGSLIENAIQHGIEPKPGGGSLQVEATEQQGRLRVSVIDSGVGLGAAPAGQTAGSGLGLSSLRERLRLLHGDAARLEVQANALGGVSACIEIRGGHP